MMRRQSEMSQLRHRDRIPLALTLNPPACHISAPVLPLISTNAQKSSVTMERAQLDSELEDLHAASFGWALACCGRDREEAEEVLQSAYLKVFAGKARFDGRSTFRTWLFGVIRLTAAEERRRTIVRRERALGSWPRPEHGPRECAGAGAPPLGTR